MNITKRKKIGLIAGGVIIGVILIAIICAIGFPNPLGVSIRRITQIISFGVIVAVILIITLFIYRVKQNKRVKKIASFFLCLSLILVVAANCAVSGLHVILNQFLDKNKITAEQIPDLTARAKVLSGEINPSGRLVDTYAYDVTSCPAYYNAGSFTYLGSEYEDTSLMGSLMGGSTKMRNFVNYQEGIYIGYRYYETAAADGFINYDTVVQYPFGYGLSYTSFEKTMSELTIANDTISVDVTVTNTGDTAGKDVVQLYYTPPYTKGGIEKAHVVLVAFDKTEVLEPGQKETITLSFAIEDMASYDYQNTKGYIVEVGDYEIKLMNNSHDLIDSRVYTATANFMGRKSDLTPASNQFDDAAGDVKYISRADWTGTMPTERTKDIPITEELMAKISDLSVPIDTNAQDIVVKKHGLKLADMKGLAYDDPQWDKLLEQLSVKDMEYLIGSGGWQTVAIPAVGKPQVIDSGNDMMLSAMDSKFLTTKTATGRQNLRTASHNILFTVANSNALELVRVGVPNWIWILTIVDTLLLGLITWGVVGVTKEKKERKEGKRKK